MADVLIVGCGYLGSRVAARFQQQGHRVFATTRSPPRAAEFEAAGITPVVCDVTEPDTLRELPRVDAVVYCVGLDRGAGKSMREVYVDGLTNFFQRLPSPGKFVFVSSTSVYGQHKGEEIDEASLTEPVEESGRIVLAAEQVLRQLFPPAIVLRFAGIYGPGRLLREKAIRAGEPLAIDPDKWLNLIHVDDGTSAVMAALERGQEGETCIVCDDCPVRRGAFYECLARELNAPVPRFVPAAVPETANRRLSNRRLRQKLAVDLLYPDYKHGLRAACHF